MIVTEIYGGQSNLKKTYSDRGMMILQEQTGIEYEEAIDLVSSNFTYIETDKHISDEEYGRRFSVVQELRNCQSTIQTLTEVNDMLTECILEMSELLYE